MGLAVVWGVSAAAWLVGAVLVLCFLFGYMVGGVAKLSAWRVVGGVSCMASGGAGGLVF